MSIDRFPEQIMPANTRAPTPVGLSGRPWSPASVGGGAEETTPLLTTFPLTLERKQASWTPHLPSHVL